MLHVKCSAHHWQHGRIIRKWCHLLALLGKCVIMEGRQKEVIKQLSGFEQGHHLIGAKHCGI